ncbi:unnamed protein product [Chilo suppressalis]|uniref:Endonuclease III homolog n=1 Tax=Chilo suppressalis TaxID=168631 RepID=A0ABN8AV53_CHISP|nr:unnamed protein product [Chilo suppressalis]
MHRGKKQGLAKIQNKNSNDLESNYEETGKDKNISEPTASKLLALNEFKFQKKPHITIEYEKNSCDKEDQEERKGLWEPQNWKDFLVNLKIMRSNNDAPVDTMGCHKAMDENAPPEVMRYQSLIALMLSSQTKDQVTFAAMERLRAKGLTVDNVLAMSDEELGQLIYPVGFWKTKVKYIKKTTQTLKDQYKGDIPDSADKLCKLTGVGPKMAHICMQVAWNKVTGIGVDTHVHRISNRIGWVRKPTATPEDTRKALQTWLPFELWSEVNHLMVGFGQTICLPINPICNECLNRDICPSSGQGRKSPKKSPIKTEPKSVTNEIDNALQPKIRSPRKKLEVDVKEEPTIKSHVQKQSPRIKYESQLSKTTNIKPETIKQREASKSPRNKLEVDVCRELPKKSPVKRKSPQNKDEQLVNTVIDSKPLIETKKQRESSKSPRNKLEVDVSRLLPKKSPVKRKSPQNKDEQLVNTVIDSKPLIETKKQRESSKSPRNKLEVDVCTELSKKSPVKRKSPRNKDAQQLNTICNYKPETKKAREASKSPSNKLDVDIGGELSKKSPVEKKSPRNRKISEEY